MLNFTTKNVKLLDGIGCNSFKHSCVKPVYAIKCLTLERRLKKDDHKAKTSLGFIVRPFQRGRGGEDCVDIRYISSRLLGDILKKFFIGEVTQTQKDKHCMY